MTRRRRFSRLQSTMNPSPSGEGGSSFFADGKLKKIDVTGGPAITLCDAATARGGSWSEDGIIIFGTEAISAGGSGIIQKVSAAGGTPTPITKLAPGETLHLRPTFLPDGRHFLLRTLNVGSGNSAVGVSLGSLDSFDRRSLFSTTDTSPVTYAGGYLLFVRDTTLMAQRFDLRRLVLVGDSMPIAEQLQPDNTGSPLTPYSVSQSGVLIYQTGAAMSGSQLVWFDRHGSRLGTLGDPAQYREVHLSPNGKRAVVAAFERTKGSGNLWMIDTDRELRTRFTFDPFDDLQPVWAPDGSRLVFASPRKGHRDLYVRNADGAVPEELVYADNREKTPSSWSPDGRHLLATMTATTRTNTLELWTVPIMGDRNPVPFLQADFNTNNGQFSPDGRWVVYQSTETGRPEVYVTTFPTPRGKWQISSNGGGQPHWRRDGKEIFFVGLDSRLMAAEVNSHGESFEIGRITRLLNVPPVPGGSVQRYSYDVTADGQRFLIIAPGSPEQQQPPTVVVNWTAALKK